MTWGSVIFLKGSQSNVNFMGWKDDQAGLSESFPISCRPLKGGTSRPVWPELRRVGVYIELNVPSILM